MKYILFSLVLISFAHADPDGECRRIFKSSKSDIGQAADIVANTSTLFKKQEEELVSNNLQVVRYHTKKIDAELAKSKKLYKGAIAKLSKAFRLCSGRSNKAKRLTEEAKEGIRTVLFKENFNKEVLKNI